MQQQLDGLCLGAERRAAVLMPDPATTANHDQQRRLEEAARGGLEAIDMMMNAQPLLKDAWFQERDRKIRTLRATLHALGTNEVPTP